MTRKVLGIALFLVLSAWGSASALQAVGEVAEDAYYTLRKAAFYPGASLTAYYAPLPVFFEGWKSNPRQDIVQYAWNYGDGSPVYYGFNGAHVYETPGTYYAKLTVKDKYGRVSSTPAIRIDVWAPNGDTYYVDAELGNDANTGLSPDMPWRSAYKAFSGLLDKRYGPGDRVLFKRGQTFEMECGRIVPGMYKCGYGYQFGAYGEGPKPIIQKVGSSTSPMIKQSALGFGHIAFQDLEFRMTSPEGVAGGEVFAVQMEAHNILFLRVDIKDMCRGLGINGGYDKYRISGVFVQDCTMFDSTNVQLYARCARLALMGNNFDLSENHINYLSYLDKAVIVDNIFTRPPFGRTALRISASSGYAYPSNNICIMDNWIQGWIDPLTVGVTHGGNGVRYTWQLVDIGPNKEGEQSLEYIAFKRNTIVDAETMLVLGDATNVEIDTNTFYTDDKYAAPYRIQLGSRFESRPLENVRVVKNKIVSNEARQYYAGAIGVMAYTKLPYEGRIAHQGIEIYDNSIELKGCNGATAIYVADPSSTQLDQVKSDRNKFYTPAAAPANANLFMIGSDYVKGTLISLSEWRSRTGEDVRSAIMGTTMNLTLP